MNMQKIQSFLTVTVVVLMFVLAWILFARFGPVGESTGPEVRRFAEIYAPARQSQATAEVPPKAEETVAPAADGYTFDDGLWNPVLREAFDLDELGQGVSLVETYAAETGSRRIRITRTRNERGTAHFSYEYRIELAAPGQDFRDITPDGFRTIEGADCSLQKLRFVFAPSFQVVKISRTWEDTWATPTMAARTIYSLIDGELHAGAPVQLEEVCDVSELF